MLQRKANQSIGGGRKATKQGGMDPNTKIKKKKKKTNKHRQQKTCAQSEAKKQKETSAKGDMCACMC